MAKYLKLFENHTQYEEYITGETAVLPNVSHCINEVEVHYNPIVPFSKQYFTLEFLTSGTISWNVNLEEICKTISYSLDNGQTWTEITSVIRNPIEIEVEIGDKMLLKGENEFYGVAGERDNSNYFRGSATFNAYGNILSLFYGDDFADYDYFPEVESEYYGQCFGLFWKSNLVSAKNIIFPQDETNMNDYTYYKIFIGSTITEIPNDPILLKRAESGFEGCNNLTSVIFGDNIEIIGESAFNGCSGLTSVTIPSSVTSIGNHAFIFCGGLTSVTIEATTPPTLGSGAFNGNASGRKIYVPSANVNAYKTATNWSGYAADIEPIQ